MIRSPAPLSSPTTHRAASRTLTGPPTTPHPHTLQVLDAVVTVPAHFSPVQRRAVVEAARAAGLQRVTLLQGEGAVNGLGQLGAGFGRCGLGWPMRGGARRPHRGWAGALVT